MWGWWYSGGGEINMISDCINEQIAWQVMGKVDAKLKTPWAVRSRTRNAFIKSTSGAVSSGVTPVWKGLYDTVQKAKPTIADALGKVAAPIAEAQGTLQGKIMELVEAGAKDTLNSKVAPALGGLIDIVFAPVLDSFKLAIVAFENAVTAGKEKFEKREDHMHMVYHFGLDVRLLGCVPTHGRHLRADVGAARCVRRREPVARRVAGVPPHAQDLPQRALHL